ncbi:MAG TPA: sensor domain-containing diguanylate cyclase [Clostridia bacterium]|nr:sensor domain-containing diguanylate cyclase [Clostridia bacterium]
MPSKESNNMKSKTFDKHGEYIIQLYRALNRQHSIEGAVNVLGNLIYKKFGYRSIYLDTAKDNKTVFIKNLPFQFADDGNRGYEPISGIFNFKLSADEYGKVMYLEDEDKIKGMFSCLGRIISPSVLLSTPVFSQNKMIGVFIVYNTYRGEMVPELENFVQLAAKELTAVFSRIERYNSVFENMLNLAALENILLGNPEEGQTASENPIQKMVSILPEATGMRECILILVDKSGGQTPIPYCSNPDAETVVEEEMYFLNAPENKGCAANVALETKRPVIIHDALTDPRCNNKLAKELGIRSIIVLPTWITSGRPPGVLCLYNGKYEMFSRRQIHFFKVVARRVGLIISNMGYIDNLRTWSRYDGLTDLLNRRTFENIYDKLCDICRFGEEKFSILMLDIDDFKSINDIYGHQAGDKILQNVAKCIKRNVREKDIVARYGGEEMVIILRDIDKKEAEIIANRIRRSILAPSVDGIGVTVSIGISTFGTDSYNKKNLIYIADKCLYKAKSIGKNQVVIK